MMGPTGRFNVGHGYCRIGLERSEISYHRYHYVKAQSKGFHGILGIRGG